MGASIIEGSSSKFLSLFMLSDGMRVHGASASQLLNPLDSSSGLGQPPCFPGRKHFLGYFPLQLWTQL